jgi:hypothetical protein
VMRDNVNFCVDCPYGNDGARVSQCLCYRRCWYVHNNPEYYQPFSLEKEMYP